MLARITMIVVASLVIASASAALAAPKSLQILTTTGCITDEGQGRFAPCSSGGGGG